jgi:diguanylate cyclase (GGDEF)-like protein
MTSDRSVILIIDDDYNLRKTLSDILAATGYDVLSAGDGGEGLALFKKTPADLALIDLKLPDISGIEVLNRIKTDSPSAQAIILTGSATLESAIEATNNGAFSYLLKPYEIGQLLLHVKRAIEKQQAEQRIISDSIELRRLNSELEDLALHDPLTGLANRRLMDIMLSKSLARAVRYARPLSIVMVDIDHFKAYNDSYGHMAGDRMLSDVAAIIAGRTREGDLAVRYGGEEFLVLLHHTDMKGARTAAEEMRQAVETNLGITISLGVAAFSPEAGTAADLISLADDALYRAKQNGRNRVEVLTPQNLLR